MKQNYFRYSIWIFGSMLLCSLTFSFVIFQEHTNNYALVIHGGAGNMSRLKHDTLAMKAYRAALEEALEIGESILKNGGKSLKAVEATIRYMEDNPLFNAGKGAVATATGTHELDASIMQGATINAGAVGGVTRVRHPITAAIEVMNNSPHVLLVGEGANAFAESRGLEMVDPDYFNVAKKKRNEKSGSGIIAPIIDKMGTVGCVALDKMGNITAGTSTGGMSGKKWNRIGDSPIIGAGTYANNKTCGISCTGHGEFFIRYAVAYDVSALMEYRQWSLSKSANFVIQEKLKKAGGNGGLVGLDAKGNIVMSFNTAGMFRGYSKNGHRETFVFGKGTMKF